ncbi:MAG: class I SAM-dependent methyltransferase [Candidatus Pacebacteria bacterium]|nr:class I SAM-dependent methyltransferase [Candidatus Paceibacterota bacterium]MBP9842567.1 class I SAM-dependent methyltransferase [Candidatus Paceibacterota bacterium]
MKKKVNTREEDITEVKEMWNEAARAKKDSPLTTTHDRILRDMEISAILKRIPDSKKTLKVLDIGCGNGFSTLEYAKARPHEFHGVDFSAEMIKYAELAKKKATKKLKGKVTFKEGDALSIDAKDGAYDIITTDRCIVNLVTVEDQKKAIKEIHRLLKKGGHAIICEGTKQGFDNINSLRVLAKLPVMKNHWHNIYLDETKLEPVMKKLFEVIEIDPFASTYYIASRVFNALAATDPTKPDYFSSINKVAALMPSFGEYSPLKVWYLKKK